MTQFTEQDKGQVARAIAGDKEAFGDLYEQFLGQIYRYIYFRVNNHQEAEDLTETVFLRAWQALAHNPPRHIPFRLWLYRIAHNAVIDFYRSRKVDAFLDSESELAAPEMSPETAVSFREEVALLDQMIQQLKAEHQQVLACRFFAGLSHKETAQVMERDERAIRALQYRALKALRSLLLTREGMYV